MRLGDTHRLGSIVWITRKQQQKVKWAGGFLRALFAGFRLPFRYRYIYRYRFSGFFGSVTIIIAIVIEVILGLSHRNMFGFDIQHEQCLIINAVMCRSYKLHPVTSRTHQQHQNTARVHCALYTVRRVQQYTYTAVVLL